MLQSVEIEGEGQAGEGEEGDAHEPLGVFKRHLPPHTYTPHSDMLFRLI